MKRGICMQHHWGTSALYLQALWSANLVKASKFFNPPLAGTLAAASWQFVLYCSKMLTGMQANGGNAFVGAPEVVLMGEGNSILYNKAPIRSSESVNKPLSHGSYNVWGCSDVLSPFLQELEGPCKKGQALELAHESPPRGPTILAQTSDAVANKIDQDDKPIPQKLISPTSTSPESRPKQTEMQQHDLQERAKVIKQHFPKALALE
eukprot:1160057-Pelagomonas_calceolata.AAC.6